MPRNIHVICFLFWALALLHYKKIIYIWYHTTKQWMISHGFDCI
jgi:hypothetical protein